MSSCWGITDGSAGMIAQVKALALSMGLECELKTISLKTPWAYIPNIGYNGFLKNYVLSHALRNHLNKPYPDIIISCGRKAALVNAALKNANPHIKTIHIQDPQMPPENFNVVVAMQHDQISGQNVIKTKFALHNITPELLDSSRKKFAPFFAAYPKPHIAVLLGGSTNKYKLTKKALSIIISDLQQLINASNGSLLITPSRRTGTENIRILEQVFSKNKNVYIYDGKSENPYLGLLACADEIMVTNDSVNMMSEAYATGKSITIINLDGHVGTKPAKFADMLKTQPILIGNEMEKLAEAVKQILLTSR